MAAIRNARRSESKSGVRDTVTSSHVFSRARSSLTRASTRPAVHLAIRLGQHLARRALLDGDENLQLPLELARRRNEILERLRAGLDRRHGRSPPLSSATSSARARIASMSAPGQAARIVDHLFYRPRGRFEPALLQHDAETARRAPRRSVDRTTRGVLRHAPGASNRRAADQGGDVMRNHTILPRYSVLPMNDASWANTRLDVPESPS